MKKLLFIPMNLQLFAEDSGAGGEVAAPQTVTEGTPGDLTGGVAGTEGSQGTPSGVTEPATQTKQTPEQDAAFADLRRKAEAAERRAIEVETQRQRDIEIAKKYGKDYNIYSDADVEAKFGKSHGLKTVAEFEAALQREEYQSKGIDPDLINKIINEHPDVKKARELTARQEMEQGKQVLNSELSKLNEEYPDLKLEKIDDLIKLPNSEEIYKLAQHGYSLLHAYEAVNKDAIRKQQSEAARQSTLNNIQGKSHVRGNGQGSEVDTTRIPDDVLEMYKRFNPGKTLDEYKAHYKRSN